MINSGQRYTCNETTEVFLKQVDSLDDVLALARSPWHLRFDALPVAYIDAIISCIIGCLKRRRRLVSAGLVTTFRVAILPRMHYDGNMETKHPARPRRPLTTMVPVTTMEEIPILNEHEEAELLASLKESEQQIKNGEYTDFDPAKLKERMLGIYRVQGR